MPTARECESLAVPYHNMPRRHGLTARCRPLPLSLVPVLCAVTAVMHGAIAAPALTSAIVADEPYVEVVPSRYAFADASTRLAPWGLLPPEVVGNATVGVAVCRLVPAGDAGVVFLGNADFVFVNFTTTTHQTTVAAMHVTFKLLFPAPFADGIVAVVVDASHVLRAVVTTASFVVVACSSATACKAVQATPLPFGPGVSVVNGGAVLLTDDGTDSVAVLATSGGLYSVTWRATGGAASFAQVSAVRRHNLQQRVEKECRLRHSRSCVRLSPRETEPCSPPLYYGSLCALTT